MSAQPIGGDGTMLCAKSRDRTRRGPSDRRYETLSAIKAPVRGTNARRMNKSAGPADSSRSQMHVAPLAKVDRRIKDDLIARVDPRIHFHFRAEVAGLSHLADLRLPIFDDRDL